MPHQFCGKLLTFNDKEIEKVSGRSRTTWPFHIQTYEIDRYKSKYLNEVSATLIDKSFDKFRFSSRPIITSSYQ